MKRFRLLGLALLALFAFGATMAASASAALPELLGAKAFPQTWTGASVGLSTLETLKGTKIECLTATAKGEQLTDTLGDYHIDFLDCLLAGIGKCNTEGDEPGVILVLGEYHYVDDFLSTAEKLGVAILFLVKTHFKCTALALILVEGHVLCLILTPLTSAATHEFHCKAVTAGMPEDKHWWNDSGVEQTAVLLSNTNEGAFEESAEIALGTVTFAEPVAFMNH